MKERFIFVLNVLKWIGIVILKLSLDLIVFICQLILIVIDSIIMIVRAILWVFLGNFTPYILLDWFNDLKITKKIDTFFYK